MSSTSIIRSQKIICQLAYHCGANQEPEFEGVKLCIPEWSWRLANCMGHNVCGLWGGGSGQDTLSPITLQDL